MKDNQTECRADYSEGLKEWLETDNSTTFGRLNRQEYQAKLDEFAEWAWELYRHLKGDEEATATEQFAVLRQLIDEQVVARQTCHRRDPQDASADPPDEDDSAAQGGRDDDKQVDSWKVESRDTPCSDCTSLQSPYDPDAGYRHDKGSGYNVHITETCGNDEVKPEAITDIEVEPMDTNHGILPGIVRRLYRSGYGPDTIYADGGYTSGLELLKIRFKGTDPVCPVPPGNRDPDRLGRHEFDVDAQTGRVLECPAGKTPFRHRLWRSKSRKKGKALHAFFYPSQCGECPMKDRCPTEAGSSDGAAYRLEMRASQIAHDQRVAEQETESFKEAYKIRSGVEATASELKRAHGIGKLRVRSLPKVRMRATLRAIGCNIKRWVKAIIDDDGSWGEPFTFLRFTRCFSCSRRIAGHRQRSPGAGAGQITEHSEELCSRFASRRPISKATGPKQGFPDRNQGPVVNLAGSVTRGEFIFPKVMPPSIGLNESQRVLL